MNKLWVDYTNHRGKREWREIVSIQVPRWGLYPPNEVEDHPVRHWTWVISVWMKDRHASRTLALESIHGFHVGDSKPMSQAGDIETGRSIMEQLAAIGEVLGDLRRHQIEEYKLDRDPEIGIMARHEQMMVKLEQEIAQSGPRPILVHPDLGMMLRSIADLANVPISQKEPVAGLLDIMVYHATQMMHTQVKVDVTSYGDLTFAKLRLQNAERQKLWNTGGITDLYRATELGGEVGELLNEVKKLEREKLGIKGSRTTLDKIAHELGDVIICCDLLATGLGIDLAQATADAFNTKSNELGFPVHL